jgi:hypothetical protein
MQAQRIGHPASSTTQCRKLSSRLFVLSDIADRFQLCLRNWFRKEERLRATLGFYLAAVYEPRLYLEHTFLGLTVAFEVYHANRFGGSKAAKAERRRRASAVLARIPRTDPDYFWAQQRLTAGGELSLTERLEDIFRRHHAVLGQLSSGDLPGRVGDTRNYLVHHPADLEGHAAQGVELQRITESLKLILQVCLLYELGFSTDWLRSFVRERTRFS